MENEIVMNGAIEYINTVQQTKTPFRVSPPVIPLSEADIESEMPLSGKILKFNPSYTTSGCFIAAINREVSYAIHILLASWHGCFLARLFGLLAFLLADCLFVCLCVCLTK